MWSLLVAAGLASAVPPTPVPITGPLIKFETRMITVAAGQDLLPDGLDAGDGGSAVLSDDKLKAAMDRLSMIRLTSVRSVPHFVVCDGQSSRLQVGHSMFFQTGLEAVRKNGRVVVAPKSERFDLHTLLTTGGRLSADRQSVSVDVSLKETELVSPMVPLTPVTFSVPPETGDGPPVPVTINLQSPDVRTTTINQARVVVPLGKHAVISGPVRSVETYSESRVPILSDLPLVGGMFTVYGHGKMPVRTLLVVTPTLVEAGAPMPAPTGATSAPLALTPEVVPASATLPKPPPAK